VDREYLISFILNHDSITDRKKLEELSDEALLMVKIQLVLKVLSVTSTEIMDGRD
jgi:hypothetical protein